MRRALLAAGIVLATSIAAAQPALTIEMVRRYAAIDMLPLIQDIEQLNRCPGVRPLDEATPEDNARARALGIRPATLWLRMNDAKFAQCLAGAAR